MDLDVDLENEKITMIKDGTEVPCDLLFTFDSPDTNRSYFAYTDHSVDEKGRINIYSAYVDPVIGQEPQSITDPAELAMVNEVIEQIQGSLSGK